MAYVIGGIIAVAVIVLGIGCLVLRIMASMMSDVP